MTPKEYCESHPTVAIHYILGGMEAKPIKLHTEAYIYFVAGICREKQTYHRCRIRYDEHGGYFKFKGRTIRLSDFINV